MSGINLLISKDLNKSFPPAPLDFNFLTGNSNFQAYSKKEYNHYPITAWEYEDLIIISEGYFFDWDNSQSIINSVIQEFISSKQPLEYLQKTFTNIDCEFVLAYFDRRNNKLTIINDSLGRLPLYVFNSEDYFILCRDIGFIKSYKTLELNKKAAFEALVLRFPIGTKTIYNNVEKVEPASLITFYNKTKEISNYYSFNFEGMECEGQNLKELAEKAVEVFVEGLKSRAKVGDQNIVTLTGGLDSRTVLGGFSKTGNPYSLYSFMDADRHASKDIEVAKIIAKKYAKPYQIIQLGCPTTEDYELFFNKKHGLSALDMTFIAAFYNKLRTISERPILFTGDGGDKVLPDLRPRFISQNYKSLVKYIITTNSMMDPEEAAYILDEEIEDLNQSLIEELKKYPEKDFKYKYIHFLFKNRVNNWLLEGEDRNRSFLTAFSPFYNQKFFNLVMSVPQKSKSNFDFYWLIINQIAPETADVTNANWGFSLAEQQKLKRLYFKQALKNTGIGSWIKKRLKKKSNYYHQITDHERQYLLKFSDTKTIKKINFSKLAKVNNLTSDNFHYILTFLKIASESGS